MEVLAGARRASESITGPRRERPALPPQFFRSGAGNYRVVWFTMDPRRDTYWYEWYEFSPGGQIVRGGASPVPGRLPEPEVEHIPGW